MIESHIKQTKQMREWLQDVKYQDYIFLLQFGSTGDLYLQAIFSEADIVTGKVEVQHTRK